MELREKIARAINGQRPQVEDLSWPDWLQEADAVIELLAKQEPVAYLYEYVSPIDGTTPVWRNVCGTWNGQQARSARPLYLAPCAQSAVPDGWIRAIDEEMVGAHIGVANAEDDYATAKEKINKLICWHVAVATDPAVNGGWQLVPIEPTDQMLAAATIAWQNDKMRRTSTLYAAMLKAAPKPEGK